MDESPGSRNGEALCKGLEMSADFSSVYSLYCMYFDFWTLRRSNAIGTGSWSERFAGLTLTYTSGAVSSALWVKET